METNRQVRNLLGMWGWVGIPQARAFPNYAGTCERKACAEGLPTPPHLPHEIVNTPEGHDR